MKIIDLEHWDRRQSYEWFSSFSNPTYSVAAKIDVTALVAFCRENKRHFYESMLYLTVRAINGVAPMRLRTFNGKVVEYESASPSFTVARQNGAFGLCRIPWDEDATRFCTAVRDGIERTEAGKSDKPFGEEEPDVYYFTCLPWLNFDCMTDPIPDDKESQSIPRICWGKYVEDGGRVKLSLNITASHALVDGKTLCDAFAAIQSAVDACEKLLGGNARE